MVAPDFVDLNKIAAGGVLSAPAKREPTTHCRQYHFVGSTNMVCAIPVALPPWCAGLKFLNPSPFFGGQNPEALQKNLHLEIFWGFRTRTAPAGGGQYLTGGGSHRGGRRWLAARLWLIRQGGGSAQGVPRDGSRAARWRRKGAGG